MTLTPSAGTTKDQEAEHMRHEVGRIQRLTLGAVEELDVTLAIAHLRSLRSLLWRAQNQKIDLTEPTTPPDSPEMAPSS